MSLPSITRTSLAAGEAAVVLHSPLPLLGVTIGVKRCQQNDSLAGGYTNRPVSTSHTRTVLSCE